MFLKTTGQLVFWWDTVMQRAGIREHMDSVKTKRHLRKALHSTVAGVPWSKLPSRIWLWASTCWLEISFLSSSMHIGPCLISCTSNGSMKGSTGPSTLSSQLWPNKDVGRFCKSGKKCGKLYKALEMRRSRHLNGNREMGWTGAARPSHAIQSNKAQKKFLRENEQWKFGRHEPPGRPQVLSAVLLVEPLQLNSTN